MPLSFSSMQWQFHSEERDNFVSRLPWAIWQQLELRVEDHSNRGLRDPGRASHQGHWGRSAGIPQLSFSSSSSPYSPHLFFPSSLSPSLSPYLSSLLFFFTYSSFFLSYFFALIHPPAPLSPSCTLPPLPLFPFSCTLPTPPSGPLFPTVLPCTLLSRFLFVSILRVAIKCF